VKDSAEKLMNTAGKTFMIFAFSNIEARHVKGERKVPFSSVMCVSGGETLDVY
jgi:hypothetical protein